MTHDKIIQLIVPIAPIRVEANDRSEMCTQALCGERASVLEKGEKDWIRIRLASDGYEGWTDGKQWSSFAHANDQFLLQRPISSWEREDGSVLQMPAGARIDLYGNRWSLNGESMTPLHPVNELFASPSNPLDAAIQFMGTPYLWGGKSVLGMDCSGLIQIAFALAGKPLPRDASQQVHEGKLLPWAQREPGHVAFFQNLEGSVIHVGIMASMDAIIHAAGEVRVDEVNEKGIWKENRLTHRFHSLRAIPS